LFATIKPEQFLESGKRALFETQAQPTSVPVSP
jgi:hypothetical protein